MGRGRKLHPLPPFATAMRSSLPLVLSLALLPALACQTVSFSDAGLDDDGTDTGTPDDNGEDAGDGGDGGTPGTPTFNCDVGAQQPCPDGQKCTVLRNAGQLVYECVPDDGNLDPFASCNPEPGTGQDQCPAGFACLESTANGDARCLELCGADSDCDAALCTNEPNLLVPVCASTCDPLAPECAAQQTCRRIEQRAFVCAFPLASDNGTAGEPCNSAADAGCTQGFVCLAGPVVPGCTAASCCAPLCDLAGPDTCGSDTLCGELDLDPQPGLDTVGACYVPQ